MVGFSGLKPEPLGARAIVVVFGFEAGGNCFRLRGNRHLQGPPRDGIGCGLHDPGGRDRVRQRGGLEPGLRGARGARQDLELPGASPVKALQRF